jgi:hypothetical protein
MSDTSAGHTHDAGRYEIRLKGHLGPAGRPGSTA